MTKQVQTIRLLGIDPGLRFTGFGVIDVCGHEMVYVASGVIKVAGEALPERLRSLIDGVHQVIDALEVAIYRRNGLVNKIQALRQVQQSRLQLQHNAQAKLVLTNLLLNLPTHL